MAYKMKGSPMQRNFGISPMKSKPTKEELTAAANDPKHPNAMKNMGQEAYYAWKAGIETQTATTYHGAGGKIMNEDGTVNKKLTTRQLEQLKK